MAHPPTFISLTTAVDDLDGSRYGYTTFSGTLGGDAPTVNAGDTLTGFGPSNVLEITDTDTGGVAVVPALYLSGIQTVTIDCDEGLTVDAAGWTGLTTLDVVSDGTDHVTAGADTNIIVTDSGDDELYTYGGKTVTVNNLGIYGNDVEIHGGTATTTVTVNGSYDEENYIYDSNYGSSGQNTISNVNINDEVDYDTYIYSNTLTQLSLSGITYHYVYDFAASGAPELYVTLDNDGTAAGYSSDYWYLESDYAREISFRALTSASTNFYLYAPSATSLSFDDAVSLSFFDGTIAGSGYLDAAAAKSVTILGAGDFTADLSGVNASALINAAGATGEVTVELAAGGAQRFIGGFGQDIVTIGPDQTGAVIGNLFAHNEIILSNAAGATQADIASAMVKGFSILGVAGTTSGVFDMSGLPSYTAFDVQGSGGDVTFSHVWPGSTLSIDGSNSNAITLQVADANPAGYTVTVELGTATTGGVSISDLVLEDSTGTGVSAVDIVSNGDGSGANVVTWGGDALTTLHLSGSEALTLDNLPATNISVLGPAFNAAATFTLPGVTAAGQTEVVTLGNGDNHVILGTPPAPAVPGATEVDTVTWQPITGTTGTTETLDVTWQAFTSAVVGSSETIGGMTITSDVSFTFTAAELATVAEGGTVPGLTITQAASGWTVTAGAGSDDSTFTSTTADAAISAPSDASSSGGGGTPTFTVTVTGAAPIGGSESIGGETVTAVSGTFTADQVATVAGGGTVAGLTVTTSPTLWIVGAASGDTTTFTSTTPDHAEAGPAGAAATGAATDPTSVQTTAGVTPLAAGGGGVAGSSHVITLGNGDNTIVDYSVGTVSITVGDGSNTIALAGGVTGTIILGPHAGSDAIILGASGDSTTAIVSITGLNNVGSDTIQFADPGAIGPIVNVTSAEVLAATGSTALLANWVDTAVGEDAVVSQTAHGVFDFHFGGNTYLVETVAATDAGALQGGDTVVELVGNYSFSHSTALGGILSLMG